MSMQGVLPGPSRFFSGGPFGKAPGKPSVSSSAEALYKASAFSGVTPQWLRDLTPNGHHMRLGSVGRADIVGGALVLNGVSGQYASTPDDNTLDVISDITVDAYVALDDWTPTATGSLVSKWIANTGYLLRVTPAGLLNLNIDASSSVSTVAASINDGQGLWVRAAWRASDGRVMFFTSTDGVTWTQLGANVASGVGVMTANATPLEIGTRNVGTLDMAAGRFMRARVFNGFYDGVTQGGAVVFDADFSTLSDGTPWFLGGTGKRITVQPARAVTVDGALWLPGVTGQYGATADNAALNVTGDLEIVCKVAADDWTPSAGQYFIAKWNSGTTKAYAFGLDSTGKLAFNASADGVATTVGVLSTVAPVIADGATLWVKVTRTSSTGIVRFWTSPDNVVWTQLGADVAATAGAMAATVSQTIFGSLDAAGTSKFLGKVFRAIVRNGIDGTSVFDVDFSTWSPGDGMNGFPKDDSTGKCVSIISDTTGADTNDPKWLKYGAAADCTGKGLYLPGVSGNYASVPDAANLDIVGDITLDVELAGDDWTPSAISVLLSKSPAIGTITDGYRLILLTTGILRLSWGDGAANHNIDSTVAVPVVDGQRLWVRGTLDVDNGAVGHDVKFFYSYDGTTWVQLGATVTTAVVTAIGANASVVEVGGVTGGTASLMTGRFFRSRIWNAYTATGANPAGGNLILDVDFTIAVVAEPYASFVTTTGQTVTINRSSSGRKAAVVDRPMFLFGTDDYMECADHATLDFALTDSLTAVIGLIKFPAGAGADVLISKGMAAGVAVTAGYGLWFDNSVLKSAARIADGALGATAVSSVLAISGRPELVVMERDVVADQVQVRDSTGALLGSIADPTTATLANSNPLRIGASSPAAGSYTEAEFTAMGLWRAALTADQVAKLDQELGTNA